MKNWQNRAVKLVRTKRQSWFQPDRKAGADQLEENEIDIDILLK